MDNTYIWVSIVFMVISLVVIVYVREHFDPNYKTDRKTFITDKAYTGNYKTILSHGDVQKYKMNGIYRYELIFNLPTVSPPLQVVDLDKSFNDPLEKHHYRVYAGKDKDDMEFVSNLERRSDGYHILMFKTEKDYKRICVYLDKTLIDCVDI